MSGLLFLLITVAAESAAVRIVLKNGAVVEGTVVSENMNFVVVNSGGSQISLLKDLIQATEELADTPPPPEIYSVSPSGPSPAAPAAGTGVLSEHDTPRVSGAAWAPSRDTVEAAGAPEVETPRPTFSELLRNPSQVKVIDLSYLGMKTLPPQISLFSNLRRLDIKGNSLAGIPETVGDLTGLEELDIRSNPIGHLPPQIMNLTGLRRLYITDTRLGRETVEVLRQQLPFTEIIQSPADVVRDKRSQPIPLDPDELAKGDSLYTRCEAGNKDACYELGRLYSAHRDHERALAAFSAACDLTDTRSSDSQRKACMEVGDILGYVYKNRERAISYYEHVCNHMKEGGGDAACEKLLAIQRRR